MDVSALNKVRHEILTEVEKEFVDELVPAKLVDHDGSDAEVLDVIMSDFIVEGMEATGEFFFIPVAEDDEIQFFVNLITIAEDLDMERVPELGMAIAYMNTYLPVGAFALDVTENTLVYKHTYEMGTEIGEDRMRDNVDLSMGVAFQAVSDFGYLLIEVLEGKRSAQSVIEMFVP